LNGYFLIDPQTPKCDRSDAWFDELVHRPCMANAACKRRVIALHPVIITSDPTRIFYVIEI